MKTFVRMAMLCVAGASLFTACRKDEQATELGQEPKTVIEQMEKEAGKPFFKKDLVLKDSSGMNQIVLRVASEQQDVLENYLAVYDIKLIPVFKKNQQEDAPQSLKPIQSSGNAAELNSGSSVVTEVISKKLQEGATGYGLLVSVRNSAIAEMVKNGRIQNYQMFVQHTSDNWPTYLELFVYPRRYPQYPNDFFPNTVLMKVRVKDAWHTQWRDWYTLQNNWLEYHTTGDWGYAGISKETIGVDGPWRAQAEVQYNPVQPCPTCTRQPTTEVSPGYLVNFIR